MEKNIREIGDIRAARCVNGSMRDLRAPETIRATLQFLIASNIPSEHKAVLMEALTDALRNSLLENVTEGGTGPWQAHETDQLQTFLEGKLANSWQHADELLTRVAAQLHRNPVDVRAKATELGFGVGVDYRLAKAWTASRAE
jgi:hypothetical protein